MNKEAEKVKYKATWLNLTDSNSRTEKNHSQPMKISALEIKENVTPCDKTHRSCVEEVLSMDCDGHSIDNNPNNIKPRFATQANCLT